MVESLARKSFFSTLINLIGAVVAYLGIFTVSRFMPSGEFTIGLIGFTVSYVGVYLPLSKLGFQGAHIKKVSEGADIGECNGAFLFITTILTALMTAFVFGTVFFWIYILHKGFETPLEVQGIWIMLAYSVINSFAGIPASTFSARREVVKSQIGTFVGHIVRVAAIVFVVFSRLSPIDVVWTYLIGGVASAAVTFYYFRGYPIRKPSRRIIHEYRKFADPLLLPSLIGLLPTSISVVLVELFWHLYGAGLFYAGYRITSVFVVLGGSVSSVIFPRISELHSLGKHVQIRESTRSSEYFLSFVLAPVSAFMLFFPEGILHVIMSNAFIGASGSLSILALWLYVSSISGPKSSLITGMNRPRISGQITLLSTAVSIGLMVIAIPDRIASIPLLGLGPAGGGVGLLGGAIVIYALSHHHARKLANTHFDPSVVYFLLAASLSYALLIPLTYVLPMLHWAWYDGLIFAIAGILIYLAFSLALKIISPDDLRIYLDAVNPLAMRRYVMEELNSEYNESRR